MLIVDDNETNRNDRAVNTSSRSGARLSSKQPVGQLALDSFWTKPIVGTNRSISAIVDYHMPGMNGLELAEAIRDRQEFATLPLVMHVSDLQRDDTRRAKSLGITSYLYKPLSRRRLMESLATALNPADTRAVLATTGGSAGAVHAAVLSHSIGRRPGR